MNDTLYDLVTWADNLTRQQMLIGIITVIAVAGLVGGGYYLGAQQTTDIQQDTPTVDSTQDAENTTQDVQKDLQNVSQELEDIESLF